MKKLVVLMALLLTAGMLWSQAAAPAAPALTVGALISYFAVTDFASGKEFSDQARFELKFNWVVDEFNTAYLEFEEGTMAFVSGTAGTTTAGRGFAPGASADFSNLGDGSVPDLLVDKAWFVTDVGKAFKLPVGVRFKFGLEEWNGYDGTRVTKSEWEDFLGERDFRTWGGQLELVPSPMMTLRTSWAWNPDANDGSFQNVFLVGAYGTVAPIAYEVTYYTNGTSTTMNPDGEFGKGWPEGGFEFNQDMTPQVNVGLAVNGEYDMGDNTGTVAAPTWRIQVGAQMLYNKMASVGIAWRGQEEATAGGLQLQGWAMPMADKPLELYVTAGIVLDDAFTTAGETFDSLEASLKYTFGKVAYYVGLYYAVEDTGNIAKEWLDMDLAGAGKGTATDTTAVWIRGVLSL